VLVNMASAFHGFKDSDNELMKQDAEIEKLTLGGAMKKCREHNIDLKDKSDVCELQRELKLKLLCKTTRKEVGVLPHSVLNLENNSAK